ncbi:MAG: FkbM family methyltransferase [Candidatus Parvarchaeota archaeon]
MKDKSNIKMKVILRDTKETKDVSYPLANMYAIMHHDSMQNPRIHNVSIYEGMFAFSYDDYNLKFDLGISNELDETFLREAYSFLKVEGKVVVDIGANIGDTAIYFAIKGAKKVIALEPYPYTFALATKNTNFSGFKDKIEIINAGYGEDKKIKIDTTFIPDAGSEIKENADGSEINIYSLKTLISKYNIDSGILKMDCEGCEYNLLNEDNETIRKFEMIQIEYHYGHEQLVKKLEGCGFSVRYTKPKKVYNSEATIKTLMQGYIYAQR